MSLAIAQHWLITVPACKQRDEALDGLANATDLICEAHRVGAVLAS